MDWHRVAVTMAIVGFPFYMVGLTAICTIVGVGLAAWIKGGDHAA